MYFIAYLACAPRDVYMFSILVFVVRLYFVVGKKKASKISVQIEMGNRKVNYNATV
jgi:hypothetical protein